MICQCGSTAFESEMIPGVGKARTCLACGERSTDGEAVIHGPPSGKPIEEQPTLPGFAAPARPSPKARNGRAQVKPTAEPPDVIKLTRQRLRFVRGEIKRLKKLEAERDRLERMLNAADGKPVAVVRELRRSG